MGLYRRRTRRWLEKAVILYAWLLGLIMMFLIGLALGALIAAAMQRQART
ncbi:MAG: hypothetical protein ABWY93_22615 [Mycobacterium sp.]